MRAQVTVVTGRANTGKTARLLARYRQRLAAGPVGVGLWLAPHQRGVAEIRSRLLDASLPACLRPNVMTFDQFASAVLAAGDRPARPIDPLVQRRWLAQLIADAAAAGRLRHFERIADRPGLVDLCLRFFAELKRSEIWPDDFRAACEQRGQSDKDRELFELFDRYQRSLVEHELYDFEGRHWTARERLRQGHTQPFEAVRFVVADGFTDFTRTQHGVLRALAAQADEIVVTLPLESATGREDLFAKTRQTLARLRQWQPKLEVTSLEPPPAPPFPALEHVESHLFGNPRATLRAATTEGIHILAAARPLDELQTIGRQIKRLLLDGDPLDGRRVSPADVAVVFRRVEDSATLVAEVFDELGLPYVLESGESLAQSPALIALAGVVELARDDWPFRALLGTLANTYLQPGWSRAQRAAAERTIREFQIPAGRQRLLEQVARTAAQEVEPVESEGGDEDESLATRRHRSQRAEQTQQILAQLAAALDRLPRRATPAVWATAFERLMTELGIDQAIHGGMNDQPDLARRDRAACRACFESLAAHDRAWSELGQSPPSLDLAEAVELLRDVLAHGRIPRSHDESGRIRVLSADSVRSLHVPYLFVANLAEKAFPPPERDDRLYDESEWETLQQAGLNVVLQAERSQEEMLLFYEVVTRATRRLYLSYPGLDDKAQPLLPSPYLSEVVRVCGDTTIDRHEVGDLRPLPPLDEPLSPAEARLLAVHRAADNDPGLTASLLARDSTVGVARGVIAAIQSIESRANREHYGLYEGLLTSEPARQRLHAMFAPDRRWTASQLEGYGYCAYQFFLRHVLDVEPLVELTLDVDYMARGRLVHAVLAELHERLKQTTAESGGPGSFDREALEREFDDVMARVKLPRFGDRDLAEAFDQLDRRLLTHWKPSYVEHSEQYAQKQNGTGVPLTAAHFEVSFGLGKKSKDVLSTDEPYKLTHRGEEFQFAGRIDRIDLGAIGSQPVFNIIDYKTGGASFRSGDVLSGRALQLTLYAMAVEDHLLRGHGAVARGVGYWYLKKNGFSEMLRLSEPIEGVAQPTAEWRAARQAVLDTIWSLVHGIREGQFPVACEDEQCTGRCEFKTVCRVTQIRSLEKTWHPPQPSN